MGLLQKAKISRQKRMINSLRLELQEARSNKNALYATNRIKLRVLNGQDVKGNKVAVCGLKGAISGLFGKTKEYKSV